VRRGVNLVKGERTTLFWPLFVKGWRGKTGGGVENRGEEAEEKSRKKKT